jgi:phosphoribosylaminoimidazole carboxylase PurE protein
MGQFLCKNQYLLPQGPRLTGSARAVKVGPGSAYLKGVGVAGKARRSGAGSSEQVGDRPIVGVLGGSKSDFPILEKAAHILSELGVPHELMVVSAHRTPDRLFAYAEQAPAKGIEVIIAGAGGAAHLPGMLAAKTHLPVIGVPIPTENLRGLDSLLSIVQMPRGIPVATVAIGGAENAGLLAAQILAGRYPKIAERVKAFRTTQTKAVLQSPEAKGSIAGAQVSSRRRS